MDSRFDVEDDVVSSRSPPRYQLNCSWPTTGTGVDDIADERQLSSVPSFDQLKRTPALLEMRLQVKVKLSRSSSSTWLGSW
ncbi:hypothetical protein TYRP_004123 [Tyrophagus putrescentiae]|nr:hypothetical protein TYRP_004123 [Tyrophagus putrescentiae]